MEWVKVRISAINTFCMNLDTFKRAILNLSNLLVSMIPYNLSRLRLWVYSRLHKFKEVSGLSHMNLLMLSEP